MSLKKSFDFGEINIWQFPVGTTVELKNNFLFFLNRIRKKKFKSIGRLHEATALDIPFLTFKSYLKPSFPNFRDLHVLLKICDCLNIPKDKLQKNISAYQFKKSRITVRCPILPIRVTPLFPMLIAHMIADGNIVRFKNKSTIYFSYRQYNPRLRLLLLEKTMTLFGELHYKEKYFFERTKIYLPVVLTRLLCNYYGFKDSGFLSKSAILPKSIMGSSKPHLLAVLIAFIIDEGHIDSGQIVIKLKNDFLLRQLSEICNKLGYKNSVKPIDKYGMTALYLLKKGVQSFWKEYLDLKRNFPAVDMGYREQKIKSNIR
ncbi:hypothetical protein KKE06_02135, partial [Candidatus Micrarchaeota archaeon]|nr:hypothetical protein [Candidatus Micrarchaeota archaeon]MBU1930225.1 hypothetical protein [Candidatus Micrarchaeota archaeon]